MAELDADLRVAIVAVEPDHPDHRRLVLVRPQSDAARRDPPFRLDPGGLDKDQPDAGDGVLAKMHQMPVGHGAVIGAVLAHGRDNDAVRDLQGPESDG
jgi:hypothetical protein